MEHGKSRRESNVSRDLEYSFIVKFNKKECKTEFKYEG